MMIPGEIIESKSADAVLNESELKYRRLFETAQDAILILDGDTGEILDANKFIIDMLGYPLDYFIGRHLWELGFIKDKSLAQDAFLKLKSEGYIRYQDLPLETKDGQRMNVEFVSNVYLVGNKKIIQCNIRDITERKHAYESLQHLANIVEFSDDAIIGKISMASLFLGMPVQRRCMATVHRRLSESRYQSLSRPGRTTNCQKY